MHSGRVSLAGLRPELTSVTSSSHGFFEHYCHMKSKYPQWKALRGEPVGSCRKEENNSEFLGAWTTSPCLERTIIWRPLSVTWENLSSPVFEVSGKTGTPATLTPLRVVLRLKQDGIWDHWRLSILQSHWRHILWRCWLGITTTSHYDEVQGQNKKLLIWNEVWASIKKEGAT